MMMAIAHDEARKYAFNPDNIEYIEIWQDSVNGKYGISINMVSQMEIILSEGNTKEEAEKNLMN